MLRNYAWHIACSDVYLTYALLNIALTFGSRARPHLRAHYLQVA